MIVLNNVQEDLPVKFEVPHCASQNREKRTRGW